MELPDGFYTMICSDIERIHNTENLSTDELLKLHRELDGKYQVCIKDWRIGLWGAASDGSSLHYGLISDSSESIRDNLDMMSAKLETFKYRMNAITAQTHASAPSTNVSVITNVGLNISFESVRAQIEDMTALTSEQTKEVLEKIDELQKIVSTKDSKKTKWEKLKPLISWLADKSVDVGIALLPLFLKI